MVSRSLELTEKPCASCGEVKPAGDYSVITRRDRGGKQYLHSWCRPCLSAKSRASRDRNPVSSDRSFWSSHLKRRYGITADDYDALLASQGGMCALCPKSPGEGSRFHVDHDHTTGRVRGVLCSKCNWGLGALGDDEWTLYWAYLYLRGEHTVPVNWPEGENEHADA